MKNLNLLSIGVMMATSILFASCTGKQGETGTPGTNGVANISSNIYSITPGTWSNSSTNQYTVNIADASINNASTDGIEVFVSLDGSSFFGLPTANLLEAGDQILYNYQSGQIRIFYFYTSAPTSSMNIKVVVIPPAARMVHPEVNFNNYQEIKSTFNLKD